jgi:hypothetical protein
MENYHQEDCCQCHKPVTIPEGFAKKPADYPHIIELDNCDYLHRACATDYRMQKQKAHEF